MFSLNKWKAGQLHSPSHDLDTFQEDFVRALHDAPNASTPQGILTDIEPTESRNSNTDYFNQGKHLKGTHPLKSFIFTRRLEG